MTRMRLGLGERVGGYLHACGFEKFDYLGAVYAGKVFEENVDGVARLQAVGEVFDRHAGA